MSRNLIKCPNCKVAIGQEPATFKESEYPYFDVHCELCGHNWRAHHKDWYAAPGSRKSPRFGKRLANRPIAHIGRSPDVHDQLVLRSLLYFV